jgi:alpha-tubulin suppressor-like RCC1 family protein
VQCWGSNDRGQLGDGTTTDRSTPIFVGVTATTDLALGDLHTCALRADNTVRCWGANFAGQLGDGTKMDRSSPVGVTGLTDATQITADQRRLGPGLGGPPGGPGLTGVSSVVMGFEHACALLDDQTVRCWGQNNQGALADGTNANRFRSVVAQVQ